MTNIAKGFGPGQPEQNAPAELFRHICKSIKPPFPRVGSFIKKNSNSMVEYDTILKGPIPVQKCQNFDTKF